MAVRWLSRRHRGSQTGDLTPVVHISAFPEGADPAEIARAFSYAIQGRRPPGRRTARQVIGSTLAQNPDLAAQPDYLHTLVDYILLDLGEAGLEIVAREDVE